jgi:PRTRC genetic system protein A
MKRKGRESGARPEPAFKVNGLFPAYVALDPGFNPESIQESFAYILDGQGWKLFKRNGISTALIAVENVQGLAALEQSISFQAEQIPLNLIRRVTAWFKAVYQKYQSEAVGYLFYQPSTREWDFIPPTQSANGASALYEAAPKKNDWKVVGTIHSHGSMSAFHSGTDDKDEEFFDGVHITVGRVDSVPEYSCSIVVQGVREIVEPSVIVDGMASADAVPSEWLDSVKESKPQVLLEVLQDRADKLYEAYYAGKISEEAYHRDLAKIEKEEDAFLKAEEKRQAAQQQTPVKQAAEQQPQVWSRSRHYSDEDLGDGYDFFDREEEEVKRKGGRRNVKR